jgi:hypothetical protein
VRLRISNAGASSFGWPTQEEKLRS